MNWIYRFLVLVLTWLSVSLSHAVMPDALSYDNNFDSRSNDALGNTLWQEERRAYGAINTAISTNRDKNLFTLGYTGHQEDANSNLVYAKARYYHPEIGRFYAPDPIPFRTSDLTSINRYVYGANNPYKYVDPTGEQVLNRLFPATFSQTCQDKCIGGSSEAQLAYAQQVNSLRIAAVAPTTALYGGAIIGPTGATLVAKETAAEGLSQATGGWFDLFSLSGLFKKVTKKQIAHSVDEVVDVPKSLGDIFKAGRTPKASELKQYAESQGWKPTQSEGGPLKYIDENGIARVTIKQGSSRAPGSSNPHVELKDAVGQRIDPEGNPVTRKSPGNHTPIDYDL